MCILCGNVDNTEIQCVLMYDKGPSGGTQTSPGLTQCDYPTVSWLPCNHLYLIIISSYFCHHIIIFCHHIIIFCAIIYLYSIIISAYCHHHIFVIIKSFRFYHFVFVNQALLIKLSLQRINGATKCRVCP